MGGEIPYSTLLGLANDMANFKKCLLETIFLVIINLKRSYYFSLAKFMLVLIYIGLKKNTQENVNYVFVKHCTFDFVPKTESPLLTCALNNFRLQLPNALLQCMYTSR